MPGGCRFGNACKYVHSQEKTEMPGIELNFLGLPIRPVSLTIVNGLVQFMIFIISVDAIQVYLKS